jgi:hypothetical protein
MTSTQTPTSLKTSRSAFTVERQFTLRLAITSILSLVELGNLFSPTLYRIASSDPALEAIFGVLMAVWAGSLSRMWFLTFKERPQPSQKNHP